MYLWSENSSHDFAILHIPILFLMALARVKTFKTRLTPHTNTTDIISMKNRSRDRDSRNTFFWSLNEHFLLTCKNTFKHLKNYFSTRGPRACRNVACCDSSRLGVRSQVQCWTTNCERVGQNKTGRTTSPNPSTEPNAQERRIMHRATKSRSGVEKKGSSRRWRKWGEWLTYLCCQYAEGEGWGGGSRLRAISCRGGGGMPSPDLLRLRVRATSSLWARAHGTGHRSFIRRVLLLLSGVPPAIRAGQGRALESGRGWVDAEGLERRVEPWRRPAAGTGARVAASRLQGAQSCPGPPRLNARRGRLRPGQAGTPADFIT